MMMRTSVPKVYNTWNPADNGGFVLTGGNLSAYGSAAGISVRGTQYKTSGKWYMEHTLTAVGGTGWFLGVCNATQNTNTYIYSPTSMWQQFNGYAGDAASVAGNGVVLAIGDVWSVAVDFASGVTLRKNNSVVATVTNFPSGGLCPAISDYTSLSGFTSNFGASAFVYTPPSGYNPGWYI
jgi:hypothetical protein